MNNDLQEKVLQNLITLYKSRGLSLEKMFQNPMFQRLPIEQKIAMVKRLGEQSGSGHGAGWDKEDAKKLLIGLGVGVLAAALAKGVVGNWTNPANAAASAADKFVAFAPSIMGVIGAGSMAASQVSGFKHDYKLKRDLYDLNTNDDNAIINYLART